MLAPKQTTTKTELPITLRKQGWPTFHSKLPDWLDEPDDGLMGIDLEYHRETHEPYMASIALSDGYIFAGDFAKASKIIDRFYNLKEVRFVGHNVLSADCAVLAQEYGCDLVPRGGVIDTLLAYYAMNQHLCHGNQEKDDDIDDSVKWGRGPGRLRLGSMTSQYLRWAEYKSCRGSKCVGPCPEHQELWYNALDAYAPLLCWQEMLKEAKTFTSDLWPNGMPLERTHNHLVDLQIALNAATARGIPVDIDFVKEFEKEILESKTAIFPKEEIPKIGKSGKVLKNPETVYDVGFNPNSPKEAKDWALAHGVRLVKYSPDGLKEALEKYRMKRSNISKGSFEYVEEVIEQLIEYKKLGRGVKSWFDDKYIKYGNMLKPEWMAYGGSMGRPVSRRPNVQNIPARGFLKKIRRALKAPKGLKWLKADAAQGEFRIMGYIGGVDPMDMGEDAFQWLVDNTDRVFYEVARETVNEYLKKPRNGAKQMVHACDYGEGMRLLTIDNLGSTNIAKQEDAEVLFIFHDWVFADEYVVGFDGVNLAKRMYGSSSWRNRKKALAAQMKFMGAFPAIQRAQEKIMDEAAKGYVLTPSGHLLKLYNDNRDNVKKALAMNGQCSLAAYMQESFIEYSNRDYPAIMFIHDELGFLVPEDWSKKKCLDYVADMSHHSRLMSGFRCPIEASWGPSYGQLEEIRE